MRVVPSSLRVLIDDPIVRLMMAADHVVERDMLATLLEASDRVCDAPAIGAGWASTPPRRLPERDDTRRTGLPPGPAPREEGMMHVDLIPIGRDAPREVEAWRHESSAGAGAGRAS